MLFGVTVRQLLVRWWKAVADDQPNSYRADPSTVRFRPIERMNPWTDEKNPDDDGRVISDYLSAFSTAFLVQIIADHVNEGQTVPTSRYSLQSPSWSLACRRSPDTMLLTIRRS